jgi:maleate isomerase
VTDPLAAIIAATRALRVENIGFLTPYAPQVSARMRGRLEQAGLSIASFGSFEESHDPTVARITPDAIRRGAIAVAEQAPCDAIFIACTNLRCLDVIPEIEAETGIPVLSSNQAMGWHMLRLAGVNDQRPGFGRLFSAH